MRSFLHTGLIVSCLLALSACSDDDGGADARIRLLNVSPGFDSLDLYVETEDDDDRLTIEAVSRGEISEYVTLSSDIYNIEFKRNGASSSLLTLSEQTLTEDSYTLYVAYGSSGRFSTFAVEEDLDEPDSGEFLLRVLNTAETGTLDVYLTEPSVPLDEASPVLSVANANSASATVDSGSYRLRVTGGGDASDLRLDVPDVSFDSRQIVSLILTGTESGVLVDAYFLPQQGELSANENTRARVRGAVGIAAGTAATASIGGVTLLTNSPAGIIGNRYEQIDAGVAAVSLSVDGNPVDVPDQTLAAGADYTLLIWDEAGATRTTLISDDNRLPATTGKARIRLLNGMSGLGEPITLTVDFFPTAEGIVLGEASDLSEVDSGLEYQLDVTNADTAESLFTQASVLLQSAGVYTMFMTGGGAQTVRGVVRKDR